MPDESPSTGKKRCPKCGSALTGEPVFCKNCGMHLLKGSSQQNTTNVSNQSGGTTTLPYAMSRANPLTSKQFPPDLADRYTESEFIGKDGFARVFKAKRKDDKYVAVKVPISLDAFTGRSFIAEMQNWTKLDHPNIVRVFDYNIMPMPYFEMELCDGSLAETKKPVEVEEAAWIVFNICEGLKFAHAQKSTHRDLKPQNILLKNGVPKISDWGLSKVISDSTSTTDTSFTPYYAAPEQVNNKPKDERTDIWQIGVILYELVTGVLPFTGDRIIDIMLNIATKDPKRPGEIKPDANVIDAVVMKCLQKDPTKRYQSVLELQKDLAMYLKVRENIVEMLKTSVSVKNYNHQQNTEESSKNVKGVYDFLNEGIKLASIRNYRGAIQEYDKVLSFFPNDSTTLHWKHLAQERLNEQTPSLTPSYMQQVDSYDKAIAINPKNADAWNNRGNALHNLGRYAEAVDSYDKAIAIKPDFALAWVNRGVALLRLGRHEEALASCDKAIAIKPDFALAWFNRGLALHNLRRNEDTVTSFDKALAIKSDFALAWALRGEELLRLGRHEEALASCDKAIAIKPDYFEAWYNRGVALGKLGQNAEAVDSYDKAIAIKPDYADAWHNHGVALVKLGRYAEAVDSYDKALAIKLDFALAWVNRGVALLRLGRHEEALASCDKAIAIKPDYAEAWIIRGAVLGELGRYAETVASYDKAVAINPKNAGYWYIRGNALGKLGRHEEAGDSYDKALEQDSYDAKVWSSKGNALKELKRYEEAVAAYDRVLELDPQNTSALAEKNELLTKIHLEQQQKREIEDRRILIQRIKETESFGVIPSPIKDAVQQPDALQYPDEVIALLSQLDEFLTSVRPQINLVLSSKQIALDTWEKERISITNEGSAHAKNITFEFSDDVSVRRLKPVDVRAGETKQVEIAIKAKVKGTIPLDITVTYRDARDKSYSDTFDFDIEVIPEESKQPVSHPVEKQPLSVINETEFTQQPQKQMVSEQPQITRASEFFDGYIRVKVAVKNISRYTVSDVFLDLDIDDAILSLERHEPEYPMKKGKIKLGNIKPQNDRAVSLYLEPLICAKEGTDINCHVLYKDAQGNPGSFDMQPIRIQVVCPIFETKEPINIGMLKDLIEKLPKTNTTILSVPHSIDGKTMETLCRGALQSHDIQHIRTLRRENISASWYYGRTKVTQKDTVIKLGIDKDHNSIEITAWSHDSKDLTGLLAELNRQITEEMSRYGTVQKIFNVTIKDSVVQRTNLMSFCDAEGKCSGDVTIEDSVIMRSNIL